MNVQNGEQLRVVDNPDMYAYEDIRRLINSNPPQVDYQSIYQATGCSTEDRQFYEQMKRATQCSYDSEDPEYSTLQAALNAGQIVAQEPFSCMIDLIKNYSGCHQEIPAAKRKAAFKAFSDVTGYRPADLNAIFNSVDYNFDMLVNFNSFYMFMPTLILFLIIIWLMVGFKWMALGLGLFLTVLVVVVYYAFTIAYRINFEVYMRDRRKVIQNQATLAQNSFENSIASWPQGMLAAACAVTCDDPNGCWTCNEYPNCPPCRPGTARCPTRPRVVNDNLDVDVDIIEPAPPIPAPVINRRLRRR